jgi:menaquinone-dependent protoporphyrinogen oxidase
MRVLVSAASQQGATAEIAKALGEELATKGLNVKVASPDEVAWLAGTDAVVLGSAVYRGHWMASAVRLAERVGTELVGRPVWLFSSGPVGDPSRKLARSMGADPVDLPSLMAKTKAREHRMFAGKLDPHELHGLQRAALFVFRGLEGDFRDWAAVRDWADDIAGQLGAVASH